MYKLEIKQVGHLECCVRISDRGGYTSRDQLQLAAQTNCNIAANIVLNGC